VSLLPREELLKALAKRFSGKSKPDKFMKPTDWSAKRDKEDDDDDERDSGGGAPASDRQSDDDYLETEAESEKEVRSWFRLRTAEGADVSADLIQMATSAWEESPESKESEQWAVSRCGAIVRALRILTRGGVAKPMPAPARGSAKDRTSELTPANFQEHSMTWVWGDGRRPMRLDYFVTTRRAWAKDKRALDPLWTYTEISPRKILVMSIMG
jgi:hypothetical protein